MSYLVVDVETTTKNDGHPFTPSNRLCVVGVKYYRSSFKQPIAKIYRIEYDNEPFGQALAEIQELFDEASVVVGFNIKFDLHWLRRYGIRWDHTKRIHDCQLGFFLETNQLNAYPSLNEAAEYYGLPPKLDVVENDYWNKGIDTPDVPFDILCDYLQHDVDLTEQIFLQQEELLETQPALQRLFRLQCTDLLALEEMEWNGLPYDVKESLKRAEDIDAQIAAITQSLTEIVGLQCVNWNSGPHVSAILYGGTIAERVKEPFLFQYKDGRTAWKEKWVTKEHHLPRLCEPLANTGLQKEGVYQTGTPVLKELKAKGKAKQIISLLLQLSELSKLNDYYRGIPELIEKMEWEDHVLHGNLNQCATVTGRLSSNKPNQQNMPEVVHTLIRSRYE